MEFLIDLYERGDTMFRSYGEFHVFITTYNQKLDCSHKKDMIDWEKVG